MSELKVSVSGIRGIWMDTLDLQVLSDFTKAFAEFVKSKPANRERYRILLGRDARPTGRMISIYCAGILNAMGMDVIDCGIVPTPTVLFGVRSMNFDGGIVVTASHNPVEWNALKFVKRGGVFTGEADIDFIKNHLDDKIRLSTYNNIGDYAEDDKVSDAHINQVINNVDVHSIVAEGFRVVLDPVNSAGSFITPWLLTKLKCEVQAIHSEITGSFERATEPTPENLTHMKKEVLDFKADVGFAQDPDADRLVVVDEKGTVLSEELTLILALETVLSKTKGDIAVNMSTSRMVDDIAAKYGVKVIRTKVGEANVVEGIEKHNALIGGEGNGGVIYPTINTARDSLVGIALVLELIAKRGKPLSEIVAEITQYANRKDKIRFDGDLQEFYTKIQSVFPSADVNTLDGLRLDWEENGSSVWVHIRPSNTEPVVRIIGEAVDKTTINDVFDKIKSLPTALALM